MKNFKKFFKSFFAIIVVFFLVDATIVETAKGQGLSLSSVETPVSCNDGNNGGINLTVGAGYSPFSYLWSNGATTNKS
jgi:SprB-like repeat protein